MDRFKLGTLASDSVSPRSSSSGGSSQSVSNYNELLVRAAPGRVVTFGTCAKVCAISFTVGVFVGFTLKRRLRRWVARVLKRMKDD